VNAFDVHDDATVTALQGSRARGNKNYDGSDDDEVLIPAAASARSRTDDQKPSIGQRMGRLVSSLVSVVARSRPASVDRPAPSTPPSSPARNSTDDSGNAASSPGGSPMGRVTMWARSLTSGSLS
jgi:hypothetical protein